MPAFSISSLRKLATCHPDLKLLFMEVIKEADCSVICGHRSEKEQAEAFRNGFSKAQPGKSKHNQMPSLAVDVVPYPIDWKDKDRFKEFAKFVLSKAKELNIEIVWGGTFSNFFDAAHYELKVPKTDTHLEK